jgi:hypothetical protein
MFPELSSLPRRAILLAAKTAVAETTAVETAVARREPAASETATAKAVTSAAKTTGMASAATTASTAAPCERGCAGRRCRYAEHDGGSIFPNS